MFTKIYKWFRNRYLRKYGTFDEIMFEALTTVYSNPLLSRIVYWSKEDNEIKIVCERPGILIGVSGRDFKKLTNFLSNFYHEDIEIAIKETSDYIR